MTPCGPTSYPGGRSIFFRDEVSAPCSTGPVGTVDAPDGLSSTVGTVGAVDTGERWAPLVEVLEHVLTSARARDRSSHRDTVHATFMPGHARWRSPLISTGLRSGADGSTKRRLAPMAWTRSRSDGRSRRRRASAEPYPRHGKKGLNHEPWIHDRCPRHPGNR